MRMASGTARASIRWRIAAEGFVEDVRYAVRLVGRNPVFSTMVVATLALGIGINSALFSLFDAAMLRLLPVANPHQLYVLQESDSAESVSYPMFQRFREALAGTADVLAFTKPAPFYTRIASAAVEPVSAQLVSGEFFPVLGVRPALGRLLTPEDNRTLGQHPVLAISFAYWQRRFGGNPNVLGSTLPLNGTPFTVVGVAEPGFFGVSVGESPDVWLPLLMQADVRYAQNAWSSNADTRKPWPPQDGIRWLDAMLRVPDPGAVAAVEARLNVLYRQDMERAGEFRDARERRLLLERRLYLQAGTQGTSTLRRRFATPLRVLMVTAGLVLLISCANAANLLLARGMARRKEIAIRLSVGAARKRLVRQLLTESLVLALLGGTFGLLIAGFSSRALPTLFSINVDVQLDYRWLAFTAGLTLATVVLFGLVPAFRTTRTEPGAAMKSGSDAGLRGGRLTLGKALVVVQVSLSLLLVSGAALLARTVWNLVQTEMGFDREHVLTVRIDPRSAGYRPAQLPVLYAQMVERVRAVPGVSSATIALSSIAGGGTRSSGINVPGYTPDPRENMSVDENFVEPGYFATVGMPLVEGRDFDHRDTETAPQVAIVNETMARRFFGSRSPIGRHYGYGAMQFQVVGVVRDAKVRGPRSPVRPMAYRPIRQEMDYARSLEVRTRADARAIAADVRNAIAQIAPDLPVQEIATLTDRIDRLLAQEVLIARLTAFFGGLALLLACTGIYGLISYAVSRRTVEMGLRMALGAQPAAVVRLVVREGMTLVAIGILLGIPIVFAAARLVEGLLFGVAPTDPPTLAATALVMLCTAALATYPAARRASRVDPMAALRTE
jgi:predicted permease